MTFILDSIAISHDKRIDSVCFISLIFVLFVAIYTRKQTKENANIHNGKPTTRTFFLSQINK